MINWMLLFFVNRVVPVFVLILLPVIIPLMLLYYRDEPETRAGILEALRDDAREFLCLNS